MRQLTKYRNWLALAVAATVVAGASPPRADAQEDYRMEKVAAAPSGLTVDIAKALQTGIRLVRGDGRTVAELWVRSYIPAKAPSDRSKSKYGWLAEGTMVGVLNLPEGGSDFRGQTIAAGLYTLRFEHIPQDGNHLGAAPEGNFVLLCRADADNVLDASLSFGDLVDLSRQASGTSHPAPLMLLDVSALVDLAEFPGIERRDPGYVALRFKTMGKAPGEQVFLETTLAVVLIGKAD